MLAAKHNSTELFTDCRAACVSVFVPRSEQCRETVTVGEWRVSWVSPYPGDRQTDRQTKSSDHMVSL